MVEFSGGDDGTRSAVYVHLERREEQGESTSRTTGVDPARRGAAQSSLRENEGRQGRGRPAAFQLRGRISRTSTWQRDGGEMGRCIAETFADTGKKTRHQAGDNGPHDRRSR